MPLKPLFQITAELFPELPTSSPDFERAAGRAGHPPRCALARGAHACMGLLARQGQQRGRGGAH